MGMSTIVNKGTLNFIFEVTIRSETTGQLLTGLTHADMTIEYQRQGSATHVNVPVTTGVLGTWSSGGWVENIPGMYQFGVPNAALEAGADFVVFVFTSANSLDAVARIYMGSAFSRSAIPDGIGAGITENTLAQITLDIAREVTKVVEGAATGGSATTLEDTFALTQADEHWEKGTLWLKETGAIDEVTSFSANTLTIGTQDPAIAAGDLYAVASGEYPFSEIVKAVNSALREIGPILCKNSALVVDSTKIAYDLPSGVSNIYKVKIADPDDETIFYWSERWEEEWTEGTSAYEGHLVFDAGYEPTTDANKIEIYYKGTHPALSEATAEIAPSVNAEHLKWLAIVNLYKWALRQYGDDSRKIPQFLQDAIQKAATLKGRRNRNAPVVRVHVAG